GFAPVRGASDLPGQGGRDRRVIKDRVHRNRRQTWRGRALLSAGRLSPRDGPMNILGIDSNTPLIELDGNGTQESNIGQFKRLLVPRAVAAEVGDLPDGIIVESIPESARLAAFPPRIHACEAEVILLGFQHPGCVLILDDWYAREFAKSRGAEVIGTV